MKKVFLFLTLLSVGTMAAFGQTVLDTKQELPTTTEATNSQINFYGGSTNVRLSNAFVLAVGSLGIRVAPLSRIPIRRGTVFFPITSGTLDAGTLRGEILHSNGLLFTRNNASVRIEGFAINTIQPQPFINGLASANGAVVDRIPLFDLNLTSATVNTVGPFVKIGNVGVTLRAESAAALNAVFETNAFVEGFNIGTAEVIGFTNNNH